MFPIALAPHIDIGKSAARAASKPATVFAPMAATVAEALLRISATMVLPLSDCVSTQMKAPSNDTAPSVTGTRFSDPALAVSRVCSGRTKSFTGLPTASAAMRARNWPCGVSKAAKPAPALTASPRKMVF